MSDQTARAGRLGTAAYIGNPTTTQVRPTSWDMDYPRGGGGGAQTCTVACLWPARCGQCLLYREVYRLPSVCVSAGEHRYMRSAGLRAASLMGVVSWRGGRPLVTPSSNVVRRLVGRIGTAGYLQVSLHGRHSTIKSNDPWSYLIGNKARSWAVKPVLLPLSLPPTSPAARCQRQQKAAAPEGRTQLRESGEGRKKKLAPILPREVPCRALYLETDNTAADRPFRGQPPAKHLNPQAHGQFRAQLMVIHEPARL